MQVHHAALAGDLAVDAEQGGAKEDASFGFKEFGPHDHVDPAGFIFEGGVFVRDGLIEGPAPELEWIEGEV